MTVSSFMFFYSQIDVLLDELFNGVYSVSSVVPALICFAVFYLSCGYLFNVERISKKFLRLLLIAFICNHVWSQKVMLANVDPSKSLLNRFSSLLDGFPSIQLILGDLMGWIVGLHLVMVFVHSLRLIRVFPSLTKKQIINAIGGSIVKILKKLPFASSKIQQEVGKIEEHLEESLKGKGPREQNFTLPKEGWKDDVIISRMTAMITKEDKKWQDGKVSGAVYHGELDHLNVLNKAYSLFSVTNPLHADIWPSVMKFEAEVISMTASLLNGGNTDVCGVLTSGGTESIVLATKTHRDWYREVYGITRPEIVAPVTAHAAIDKACDILGIKLIKVPVDPVTFQVDVSAVRWSITSNTIMLYSSAPNFPQGIVDDIPALSSLARTYNVGLHVDCCLGGFILPFLKNSESTIPTFDFELPGVTSMSVDTHKYGYAAKGTSVVLYKDKSIRKYQYFCFPDWTGGLYVTPTIAGSRPGALSAAAWASLMRLGEDGFRKNALDIVETAREIRHGIEKIEGLYVLGDPQAMVICFGSQTLNIFRVGDLMTAKGWSLNSLQHPICIHICVTVRHLQKASIFLQDLKEATEEVMKNPNANDKDSSSAIYGMAATMPAGPVVDVLRAYTDVTLKV